jgi:hypothetical protein
VLPLAAIFRPQLLFRRRDIAAFLAFLVLGFVRCAVIVKVKMPRRRDLVRLKWLARLSLRKRKPLNINEMCWEGKGR